MSDEDAKRFIDGLMRTLEEANAKPNEKGGEDVPKVLASVGGIGSVFEMDGKAMLINILMATLRRQVLVSSGARLDSTGFQVNGDEAHIEGQEVKAAMVKLASQGLKDCIYGGFMSMETAKEFSIEVCDLLSAEQLSAMRKRSER